MSQPSEMVSLEGRSRGWPRVAARPLASAAEATTPTHLSRLAAGLAALLLLGLALLVGERWVAWQERGWAHQLGGAPYHQKEQGGALQAAALREPDVLVLVGSSELYDNANRAFDFFHDRPTGFEVFAVGKGGSTALIDLQRLASMGGDLRGKKVVISFTPSAFFDDTTNRGFYAGNFSRFHAGSLAFSLALSDDVKRAAARRMLAYPDTLEQDPVLRYALLQLASGSRWSRLRYAAVLPLGLLQNQLLRLQDQWEVLASVQEHLHGRATPRPREPDWPALFAQGEELRRQQADNPFGFNPHYWRQERRSLEGKRGSESDASFRRKLVRTRGWDDLDLLLRITDELGARPLILSSPLPGRFYNYTGVSARARDDYYQRLRAVVAAHSAAVRDFQDHDLDLYFVDDRSSHLSPRGWLYVNQALDTFWHDRLR